MRAVSPPSQRPEPPLPSYRPGGSVGDFFAMVDSPPRPLPAPIVSGSGAIFQSCLNKLGTSAIMVLGIASIFEKQLSLTPYNLKQPMYFSILGLAGIMLFVNLYVKGYFNPLPAHPDFTTRIARHKEHLEKATKDSNPDKEKIQRLVADYKRIHTTEWSYHAKPLRQIYDHEIQQLENSTDKALDKETYECFIRQKLEKIPEYRLAQDQLAIATERLDTVINLPGYPHLLSELYIYDRACGNVNEFLIKTYTDWSYNRSASFHFT